MSLARLTLRALTRLALTGRTMAGDEVSSSDLTPLNELDSATDHPIIAVFTDQVKTNAGAIVGLDMLGAATRVTLALEMAVFQRPPQHEPGIPPTDEGFEMVLDLIERAALAELQAGTSVWADLWRTFVLRVEGLSCDRGATIQEGVKIAARRVEIEVELISDPVPGQPLKEAWQRALAALEADPRAADVAVAIRASAEGVPMPAWRGEQGALGLTDAAARAVAIGPLPDSDAEDGGIRAATELATEDTDRGEVIRVDALAATIQHRAAPALPLSEPDPDGDA